VVTVLLILIFETVWTAAYMTLEPGYGYKSPYTLGFTTGFP
jgi:hypothetical protein